MFDESSNHKRKIFVSNLFVLRNSRVVISCAVVKFRVVSRISSSRTVITVVVAMIELALVILS